uniref:TRAP transporter small permease n=1 Tax=Orrella sp. TaxID=1921583 RepID=UPI00404833D5
MSLFGKLGQGWDRFETLVGGLFLTLAVFIVVIEIVSRNLFAFSMIGADEIASFAVIWSVFFTASIGVKRNIHVRIDVLFFLLPAPAARWLDGLGTLISLFFTAYLTYSGWALVQESIMFGELTMTMLRLPIWIPQSILPIGGFLLSVRLLQRLYFLVTDPETILDSLKITEIQTESKLP